MSRHQSRISTLPTTNRTSIYNEGNTVVGGHKPTFHDHASRYGTLDNPTRGGGGGRGVGHRSQGRSYTDPNLNRNYHDQYAPPLPGGGGGYPGRGGGPVGNYQVHMCPTFHRPLAENESFSSTTAQNLMSKNYRKREAHCNAQMQRDRVVLDQVKVNGRVPFFREMNYADIIEVNRSSERPEYIALSVASRSGRRYYQGYKFKSPADASRFIDTVHSSRRPARSLNYLPVVRPKQSTIMEFETSLQNIRPAPPPVMRVLTPEVIQPAYHAPPPQRVEYINEPVKTIYVNQPPVHAYTPPPPVLYRSPTPTRYSPPPPTRYSPPPPVTQYYPPPPVPVTRYSPPPVISPITISPPPVVAAPRPYHPVSRSPSPIYRYTHEPAAAVYAAPPQLPVAPVASHQQAYAYNGRRSEPGLSNSIYFDTDPYNGYHETRDGSHYLYSDLE